MFMITRNKDGYIPHLINDGSIDIKSLSNKRMIIVGERHADVQEMKFVDELIRSYKPNKVLVEALGDLRLITEDDKLKADATVIKELHYELLTKMWIRLSLKHNQPFYGIELIDFPRKISLKQQFILRESHFLKHIQNASNVHTERVIVIVGDTHLRTIVTEELGDISPIHKMYGKSSNVAIIRSSMGEIA